MSVICACTASMCVCACVRESERESAGVAGQEGRRVYTGRLKAPPGCLMGFETRTHSDGHGCNWWKLAQFVVP